MSSSSGIAKKAHAKAEVDFATWLMMAKLGGFDDLPSNAQSFLANYRDRLEMMNEAESTALAVREVYTVYYGEMGGVGAPPEPQARKPTTRGGAHQAARSTKGPSRRKIRKPLQPLLVFASMVALIVMYKLLTQ